MNFLKKILDKILDAILKPLLDAEQAEFERLERIARLTGSASTDWIELPDGSSVRYTLTLNPDYQTLKSHIEKDVDNLTGKL